MKINGSSHSSFSGDYLLANYRSVTEFGRGGGLWMVALESHIDNVPEGNTEDDKKLFFDTIVPLNPQKLADITELMVAAVATAVSEKGK